MATGKGLRRKRRIVWAVLIALAAVGWWQHRIVQAAYARLALEFTRLEDRPDIRYQPGQEKRARAVAGMLEESIRTVENALRINMRSPGVYCMATEQDYSAFTAAPGSRGACTVLREVCLSPRIQDDGRELKGILIHELTHAAVLQRIGPWKQLRKVPAWFDEGLAVCVSGGGGAEKFSESVARHAILSGKHFNAKQMGKVYAEGHGIPPHMFYRQAGMFVGFLTAQEPGVVPEILSELERGLDFPDAFERAVGMPIATAWAKFQQHLKAEIARR